MLDLGHDVQLDFEGWADHERARFDYTHPRPEGNGRCAGGGWLDLPGVAEAFPGAPRWTVEAWEPLTLSPSLLCGCGHHGFVRNGAWVPA
jgi:hypothetical protein